MKLTRIDAFLTGLLLGAILTFWGVTEFVNIIALEQGSQAVSVYGREIPVCDKPLWERIKDGC